MSAAESFFMDDPFFTHFLWPRRSMALSGFREDFLHRRAQLIQSLRNEIQDSFNELSEGLHREFFQSLDSQRSSTVKSANSEQNKTPDLCLTLDTQGFSPEDVTVTVSGKRLEVMAAKRSEKDASSSSPNTAEPTGFVQAVELPDNLNPANLTCSLGEDGLLRVESQEEKDQSSEELAIPVRFRTSLNFPITKDSTN